MLMVIANHCRCAGAGGATVVVVVVAIVWWWCSTHSGRGRGCVVEWTAVVVVRRVISMDKSVHSAGAHHHGS